MSDDGDAALAALAGTLAGCTRCPRLVAWRERVAATRRRAHRDETYWGRPVPGFGDARAEIVLVGLAPGAHGANRTGRMFTGDGTDGGGASDFLAAALHRTGLSNRPTSRRRDDGLRLRHAWLTAVCRCAPPDNRPTVGEIEECLPWLERELELLPRARVLLCLGRVAFDHTLRRLVGRGAALPRPRPRFAHGLHVAPGAPHPHLLASYHPSRQNTATGRLTRSMLVEVVEHAKELAHVA